MIKSSSYCEGYKIRKLYGIGTPKAVDTFGVIEKVRNACESCEALYYIRWANGVAKWYTEEVIKNIEYTTSVNERKVDNCQIKKKEEPCKSGKRKCLMSLEDLEKQVKDIEPEVIDVESPMDMLKIMISLMGEDVPLVMMQITCDLLEANGYPATLPFMQELFTKLKAQEDNK